MVSLTCTTRTHDGVTLVTAHLAGGAVAQRVHLENRLDGPVWPPRRHGIPEAGWDGSVFETVVPAETTVAVGYASPAPPADPAAELVDQTVVTDETPDEPVTPADAFRQLGDPSPPRDAIPIAIDAPHQSPDSETITRSKSSSAKSATPDSPTPDSSPPDSSPTPALPSRQDQTTPAERPRSADSPLASQSRPAPRETQSSPPPVVEWLDAVEARVTTAERLSMAETLPELTAVTCEVGSLEAVEELVDTLERDTPALTAVAERTDNLAARASETDVPLSTLERLT